LNNLDEDWREVDMEDMSNDDILDLLRTFTFNVNINCKDDNVAEWIHKHPDWILAKKAGK